jgi:hypothetical protein
MNLFDFVMNHSQELEKLWDSKNGEVAIEPQDFDFSHNDLEVLVDNTDLVFSVDVAGIMLKCVVTIDNISAATPYITHIKDANLRQMVIENIEETYRSEAESELDLARENLKEAQDQVNAAQKDFDTVVDTLSRLKGAWNVP